MIKKYLYMFDHYELLFKHIVLLLLFFLLIDSVFDYLNLVILLLLILQVQ